MSRPSDKRISEHTEKKAGDFLFDQGKFEESQYLDMRTRIKSEATMRALMFYGILAEGLGSERSKEIKDIVERMLISYGGKGREEAVEVLKQQFPKRVEVEKGREKLSKP